MNKRFLCIYVCVICMHLDRQVGRQADFRNTLVDDLFLCIDEA